MMPYELEEIKAKELKDNRKKPYPKIANTFIENVITNSNENALKIVWFLSMDIRKNIIVNNNKISTYELNEKDIIKETGLDIRTVMKYLKLMMKTTITFIDENKNIEEHIQLIPRIKNNHNGTIDYDIYNSVAKLIIDVADDTSGTYIDARRLLKLQNKHSIRLLPQLEKILTNNNGIEKKKTCDLRYLNSLFGTKYKRYSQIIKFVLEPIKEELDNNSSTTFEIKTIRETLGKRGKPPITGIVLIPKTKNNYQSTIFSNFEDTSEPKAPVQTKSKKEKECIEAPTQEYITKKPTSQALDYGESIDLTPNQIMTKFREFQEWELNVGKKRSFLTFLKIGFKNNWDF